MKHTALAQAIIDATFATPHGEGAYRVAERLTDAGYEAWWVGGCVRDMLRGTVPADIDIGTDATPDQIAAVFPGAREATEGLGSMLVPLNKRHTYEVTTFREEHEQSDGRHPESIVFSDREHDAKRRDFTINAVYFQPISRELFDPFDGVPDIREKLIRFIGDARVRIQHDALRMLRAVRFRAAIDGQYHPQTYAALRNFASLAGELSGTRQRLEFEKMLLGPHPDTALEDLWETGILNAMIPELADCKGVAQPKDYHHEGDVWEHLKRCVAACTADDGIDVRLAALLHDVGKTVTFSVDERIRFDHHAEASAAMAKAILDRLQYPSDRRDKICWLIAHHMMMLAFRTMPEQRKAHWYYHPWFNDLLRLFALDIAGTIPQDTSLLEEIVKDYHAYLDAHPRPAKPLLTGNDVMKILGIQPGAAVGEALAALREQQQAGMTTKREAIAFVESLRGTLGRD